MDNEAQDGVAAQGEAGSCKLLVEHKFGYHHEQRKHGELSYWETVFAMAGEDPFLALTVVCT